MLVIFGILIIATSVILGLIVLIQNPKGGGLTGVLGGFSNQLMGVKQTTDVMEKGTWIFAAIFGILCLTSSAFISKTGSASTKTDALIENMKPNQPKQAPANTATPAQPNPAPAPVQKQP